MIDNKYELVAALGKGGMSTVWLARDRRLNKLWAIKEIEPQESVAQSAANRRAAIDEASFMKRLDHPAIPRVVDIIKDDRAVFVVMDYVNGRSLSRVLRLQGQPFCQAEVIGWGIQLCDVLGYLHGLNPPIVYRDLKPGNVMLRDDGSVKLIDFGIADELRPDGGGDGRRIGSPGYSAPEQVDPVMHKATPTDVRADVYALGATLYSLVTGITPRCVIHGDGSSMTTLDLRPLREVDSALSEGLEQVILRATMHDPAQRYQTMGEMRYDLEHCEELTQAHRDAQRRKVNIFWARLLACCVTLMASAACLVGGTLLRNSSFDDLMHRASIANTEEVNVVVGNVAKGEVRTADPSEAEMAYTDAIALAPLRSEPYERLLGVYKEDGVFTPTEARRFARLWQTFGRGLAGTDRYARICYDVGVLYLCYYDYLGMKDRADDMAGEAAAGQGAVVNAAQAAVWFERALGACDPDAADYAGLEVSDQSNEYAATQAYHVIAAFHTEFSQASREGRDATEHGAAFWRALEEAICGSTDAAPLASRAEPIVQLRLYQVAFESIASPTYLAGFMRAGVAQQDALKMLETIKGRVDALSDFVAANPDASEPLYREIEEGFDAARQNVLRMYGGPVARQSLSAKGGA